ncbi:hypothetical protein AB0N64_14540 [Microbacterium sp. NPDC089318]
MTIDGWRVVADVVGHVAWPALVGTIVFLFRKQIGWFISEIEEAGWGGASVKRGNQKSKALKRETTSEAEEIGEGDGVDAPELSTPGPQSLETAPEELTAARLIPYYGRIAIDRLRASKYNTDTTSARLGAEIVGNTYADLKQAVRFVAFVLHGSGGRRGPIPGLHKNLELLQLPDDLDADIREARQFAVDVTDRKLKVDGQGASDYIDSVRVLLTRLVNWAVDQPSK